MFGTIQATTKHAINRILNGGLYRASAPVDNTLSTTVVGATAQSGTILESAYDSRTINGAAPTIAVAVEKPLESLLAAWYCYGVRALIDVKAKDLTTGVPIRSINGPTPARFTFIENGILIVEQPVTEFWGLLDREITLSFLLKRGSGDVALAVEIDYGSTKVEPLVVSLRNYQLERVVRVVVTPPYDATSFTVRYKFTGTRDQSFYLGEVMLQLGNVPDPKFTDDITLGAQPRHSMGFFSDYPAPPGYISQCDFDGRFIYPTSGDARTDGTARGNTGGSTQHNHGRKTGGDQDRTQIEKGGQSFVSRTHRHDVDYAEVDPPWTKLLLVEKL